ncbi:LysR family transcriptional regulator [Vibrio rhodolitus]|uniref:LysR family transcriptional regulator n=1 Tax=Vibrio rhodolitus TaxID=2231649 RepID=UPI000E0B5902|nr:LysR family transcriptional regulator [Vibrio rhodolitus]
MFNLQQLETLVLCVECGSFSAAARKLAKAQSAVSTTISNLEIDTGILIFDRSSRTPILTEQGRHLYRRAIALLEHSQSVSNMLQAFNAGIEAKLTVAVNSLLLTNNFYQMMGDFSAQFPDTELHLCIENNQDVVALVNSSKADIGFMAWSTNYPTGIEVGSIGYVPFSIAVNKSHPLLGEKNMSFEQVKRYRQIVLPDHDCHYSQSFSATLTHVNHLQSATELLQVTDSWLLAPDHMIEKAPNLQKLKLPDEECDWLIQVDRLIVKEKKMGVALEWLKKTSSDCYSHHGKNCVK